MERLEVFGTYSNLVGISSVPESEPAGPTAVIMITAGMLHHVGPMNLHVQLSRELVDCGIGALRFNLSGIGESLAVGFKGSSLERAASEIRQGMDCMANQYGYERFILFGLCSGADDGLRAAVEDDRVVGLSMLDGCAFPTKRFKGWQLYRKYSHKVRSPRKWLQTVSDRVRGRQKSVSTMPFGVDIREFPDRATCELQLNQLLQRGVVIQCMYTGGMIDLYSYEDQFFDMFPMLRDFPGVQIHYFPDFDHVVSLRTDRRLLLDTVIDWAKEIAYLHTARKSELVLTA